jgi:hypothetical protein
MHLIIIDKQHDIDLKYYFLPKNGSLNFILFFENFIISENNIISVEAAKVIFFILISSAPQCHCRPWTSTFPI